MHPCSEPMPRLDVEVRACGQERIKAPLERSWDSFLLDCPTMSEIFPVERAPQEQADRIAF